MRISLIAVVLLVAFAGAAWAAGPDPKAGEAISIQCAACHGNSGMSVDNNIPNLAGQHYNYLLEQLTAYKQKTRNNPIMNEMIGPLSQQQMEDIAAYYANIPIRTGPSTPSPK
jgi:cytochrome c553